MGHPLLHRISASKRSGNDFAFGPNYTGQRLDDTGLLYYNARYYDPNIGMFISPDTIIPDPTNVLDYNRYVYARGNPISNNDPTGHQTNFPPSWQPGSAYSEWYSIGGRYSGCFKCHAAVSNGVGALTNEELAIALAQMREAELTGYELAVRAVSEPVDYALTAVDCYDGCTPDVILWAMVPFMSGSTGHVMASAFDLAPYKPSIVKGATPPLQQHHGILNEWAQFHIAGYNGNLAPSIVLTEAQHDATRTVYQHWKKGVTGSYFGPVDWSAVSRQDIQNLSELMFDAAGVPTNIRQEYYAAFDEFIMNLP